MSAGDSLPPGKIGKKRGDIEVVCAVCDTSNTFAMHFPAGEVLCKNTEPEPHVLQPKPLPGG